MSIKRLHDGFNVQGDCLVSKTFPMRETDPPGLYLGRDSAGKPVYITYWVALEIAGLVGYPTPEVYEANLAHIASLEQQLVDLEADFDRAVSEHVDNRFIELLAQTKGEILEEQKRATRSLRDASKFATDPDTSRTAKLDGGEGSEASPRGKNSGHVAIEPTPPSPDLGL